MGFFYLLRLSLKGKDQTNKETGNLPKKEFRVMVVKIIQNLPNKMEAQINRRGTDREDTKNV